MTGPRDQKKGAAEQAKKARERQKKKNDKKRLKEKVAPGKRGDKKSTRSHRSTLERPKTPWEKKKAEKKKASTDRPLDRKGEAGSRKVTREELRATAREVEKLQRTLGIEPPSDFVDKTVKRWEGRIDLEREETEALDAIHADAERLNRSSARELPTDMLISEAKRINKEFQSDKTGPLTQAEQALTLETLRDVLQQRLDDAPRGADGLPQLEGVKWDADDPQKGGVGGIPPFGESHVWESHLQRDSQETPPPYAPKDQLPARVERDPDDSFQVKGFGTGSTDLGRSAVDRLKEALPEHMKERLDDPNATVHIIGHASMIGSDRVNDRISRWRADQFRNALRVAGVKARIIVQGHGSRAAKAAGKAPNDNSPGDRRVEVRIEPGVTVYKFRRGDVISVPRSEIKAERPKRPMEKPNLLEATRRAREAIEMYPPAGAGDRERCNRLIDKLADPSVDDAYLNGTHIQRYRQVDLGHMDDIAEHARPRFVRDMFGTARGGVRATPRQLAGRIRSLEWAVRSGFEEAQKLMGTQMSTIHPRVVRANKWILERRKRKDSILSYLGDD